MKLISIAKAVHDNEDYRTMVMGNPDINAAKTKLYEIIGEVMRRNHRNDQSLYREYQKDKASLNNVVSRLLDNLDIFQPTT